MSVEWALHVRVPARFEERFVLLRAQADAASARLVHSGLGDRTDIVRFEQIASQLEGIAFEALAAGDAELVAQPSSDTVSIVWPFGVGQAAKHQPAGRVREPASVWRSSKPNASRTDATFERFCAQLHGWAEPAATELSGRVPVCPSGIQNRALTEALRKYVGVEANSVSVDAPITYVDGSEARPFPLRSVRISDQEPDDGRDVMRMTLLSVRHFEMDAEVDGAWLRNREVSLPRARAQTDELVYQQSLEQLALVSEAGPLTLHMFQTGLEAANVGFYRALVDHHRDRSGHAVAVVPYYFAGDKGFARSNVPWVIQ